MPKYNDISNIPAQCFFQILKTKDFQLLKPKPKEQGLEQVFISIYDEFFTQSDNHESKRYLEVTKDIAFLEYKIASLKQSLFFYWNNQTTKEMRLEFIEALKTGYGIIIDPNTDFNTEVKRILNSEIGILNNDLELLKIDFNQLNQRSQSKDYNYFEQIGALSNVLPNNSLLKENMSLAVYVELEKLAHKIIEQKNKKK